MRTLQSRRELAKYLLPKYARLLREAQKLPRLRDVNRFLYDNHADLGICKFLDNRRDVYTSSRVERSIVVTLMSSRTRMDSFWAPVAARARSKRAALRAIEQRIAILKTYL